MKRFTVIMMSLAALAMVGCAAPHEQSKAEARQRWFSTRAAMLTSAGEARFEAGDLDAAGTNAREALALTPELAAARMLLARVHIEKAEYTEAARHLTVLEGAEPTDHRVPYLQAVVFERRGGYEEALRLYEKARAMEPTNPAYVIAAAEVLVALGRAEEALGLVEAKLSQVGEPADLGILAGDLAMLTGSPVRAATHYVQARHLDPEHPDILEKLAKARFYGGDYARAVILLQDMVRQDQYRDAAWVHTMLGDTRLALGRHEEAKTAYQRAAELAPSTPQAWVNMGAAALICGDLPRAVLAGRRALQLDPDNAEASIVLGQALLAQGKATEAHDVLDRAVRTYPNDPMLMSLLGRNHLAMGRTDDALDCFRATLKLDPDNPVAREMVAHLTQ